MMFRIITSLFIPLNFVRYRPTANVIHNFYDFLTHLSAFDERNLMYHNINPFVRDVHTLHVDITIVRLLKLG